MISTSTEAIRPTDRDTRVPIMIRTAKSRPIRSVPRMCGNTFSPASMRACSEAEYSNGARLLLPFTCSA